MNIQEREAKKEKSKMILTLAKLFGAISELNVVFTYYTGILEELYI